MRGLDPRIHAASRLAHKRQDLYAAQPHGLPGQARQ